MLTGTVASGTRGCSRSHAADRCCDEQNRRGVPERVSAGTDAPQNPHTSVATLILGPHEVDPASRASGGPASALTACSTLSPVTDSPPWRLPHASPGANTLGRCSFEAASPPIVCALSSLVLSQVRDDRGRRDARSLSVSQQLTRAPERLVQRQALVRLQHVEQLEEVVPTSVRQAWDDLVDRPLDLGALDRRPQELHDPVPGRQEHGQHTERERRLEAHDGPDLLECSRGAILA